MLKWQVRWSTLAAVVAAAKLEIHIYHIEAGIRTHSMNNPEYNEIRVRIQQMTCVNYEHIEKVSNPQS